MLGKELISVIVEEKMKTIFDLTMKPREWMARHGHNIITGGIVFMIKI